MTHTQQIIEGVIALGIKKPTKFTRVKLYGKLVHDISIFFFRMLYACLIFLPNYFFSKHFYFGYWMENEIFHWILEFACILCHVTDWVTDHTLHFSCLSPKSLFKLYYSKFWNRSLVICNVPSGIILYQGTEFHCFQLYKGRKNTQSEKFP